MKMEALFRGVSLLAISGAALLAGQSAIAQDDTEAVDSSRRMGAVTVTARRSEENLQEVPISISAFSDDDLLEKSIGDFDDVAAYTPGLTFKDFVTGFNGVATMRGLTQVNVQDVVGNVGTFVDGIYLQRGYMVNFSLADMQRIEVVKGPQSALYGQNTFSGAINVVTKEPGDEFESDGSVTLGDYGRKELKVGVGGPIIPGILGARVFFADSEYGGSIENNYPGLEGDDFDHFGGYERTAYSGTVKFTPTDDLTIKGFFQRYEREQEQGAHYTMSGVAEEWALNAEGPNQYGNGTWFSGVVPTSPDSLLSGANPDRPDGLFSIKQPNLITTSEIYRFSAEYDINDAFTVNYLFGNAKGTALENFWFPQNSYNPLEGLFVYTNQHEGGTLDFKSHEFRLNYDEGGFFKGEVGYYTSNADDEFAFGINIKPATGEITRNSTDPIDISAMTLPFTYKSSTFETEAFFARGEFEMLEGKASLSLEGRYTITDVSVRDNLARTAASNAGLDPDVQAPDLVDQWKEFTPRVSLNYFVNDNSMVYASAAKGVKSGGFNGYVTGTVPLDEDERSFGPESNWTYEIGSKNEFLDGRLFANVALFYTDWKNQQISVVPRNYTVVIGAGDRAVPGIWGSVGDSTAMGVELETSWVPDDNWSFYANLAYTDTEYGEGANNPAYGEVAGNTIPGASPFTFAGGVQYDRTLTGTIDGFAALDINYDSKQYVTPDNTIELDARTLLNGRVGVTKGPVKAFVFVKNIADEKYINGVFAIKSLSTITPSYGERRTMGVTISYDF